MRYQSLDMPDYYSSKFYSWQVINRLMSNDNELCQNFLQFFFLDDPPPLMRSDADLLDGCALNDYIDLKEGRRNHEASSGSL